MTTEVLKVSVIMPVYNGELFIDKAIKSILNQTYNNYEFIILNDGSTDKTESIINKYDDERIRYVNLKHMGLVNTLNKGLEEAQYEWIAIMHSDDISRINRLERQVSVINGRNNLVIGSSYIAIAENDRILFEMKLPISNQQIKNRLKIQNVINHSSVLYNKKMVIEVGGYNDFKNTEDYDLWLKLLNIAEFHNISEPLLFYRRHERALSASYKNKVFTDRQCYTVLEKNIENLQLGKNREIYNGIWNILYNSNRRGQLLLLKNIFNRNISIKCKIKFLFLSVWGRNLIDLYYYYNLKLRIIFMIKQLYIKQKGFS